MSAEEVATRRGAETEERAWSWRAKLGEEGEVR